MLSHEGKTLHHLGVGVDGDSCFETAEVDDEGLVEDFSGCTWSSALPEYPPWIENLDETISDYELQDLNLLPNIPLTPSNEVLSSTAKLDINVEYDNFVHEDNSRSMDTAKVKSVEYSSSACECCLCKMPEFLVIPDVSCHALSTNRPNQSSCPVVTLH